MYYLLLFSSFSNIQFYCEFVSLLGLFCRILNTSRNPNAAWQAVPLCNRRVTCLSLVRTAHLRILRLLALLCSARNHRCWRWRRQRCSRRPRKADVTYTLTNENNTGIDTHTHTHGYKRTIAAECPVLSRVVVSVLDKHSERHVRAPACALLVFIHSVCCACACACVCVSASASVFVCVPVSREPEKAANSRSVANLCCNRRCIVQKSSEITTTRTRTTASVSTARTATTARAATTAATNSPWAKDMRGSSISTVKS